jgi:hypothetical protein
MGVWRHSSIILDHYIEVVSFTPLPLNPWKVSPWYQFAKMLGGGKVGLDAVE